MIAQKKQQKMTILRSTQTLTRLGRVIIKDKRIKAQQLCSYELLDALQIMYLLQLCPLPRRQYFVKINRMQGGNPPNPITKSSQHSGPFQRTFTSKVIKLRENYIIARDNDYTIMKKEVQQLISSPKFNRFISLSKCNIQGNQNLLARYKIHEQKSERKPLSSNFNRRQLHFMRQRRPEHNSPLKTRADDILSREMQKNEAKHERPSFIRKELTSPVKKNSLLESSDTEATTTSESSNAQLIKQMVTHFEEPRGVVLPTEDPYSRGSKYYVAEVIKHYTNLQSLACDHIDNSIYFLQLFAKYNSPQNQPAIQPLTLRQKEKYKDKMTIVFDLDETLVHCFEDRTQPHQLELPVRFSGGSLMLAPLNIRPGAKEMLAELSQNFQLIIFTASHESYADEVINYLDPRREYVSHRLYRRNCQCIEEGYYIKDLRVLGRDLSRVVLVDNAAYSYCFQVANGIPILPYYEGSNDFELGALKEYLLSLSGDVRQANKRTFRLSEYIRFNKVEELVEALYL